MFCPTCGNQMNESDTFCKKCGGNVQASQQSSPASSNQTLAQSPSAPNQAQKKWFESPIVIGGAMFFCFPIGLIFLWMSKKTKLEWKVAISVITAVICIFAYNASFKEAKEASKKAVATKTTQTETATLREEKPEENSDADLLGPGESFTTKVWKVTLNGAGITNVIDEKSYMKMEAEEGSAFIVVDVTFENITKETQPFSSMFDQFKISTEDGYSFDEDIEGRASVKLPFEDGSILPGKKRSGNIVFKVNDDVKNAVFEIRFTSVTARWRLYGEPTKDMTIKEITTKK